MPAISALPFRLAVCNELFEKRDFAESCRMLRKAGWQGLELAPFTLTPDPTKTTAAERKQIRDIMASEGIAFAGMHWLMVTPPGLHVTTPDAAVRRKSWEFLDKLIDFCADLGPNGVMVFGSPKQRSSTGGLSPEDATRYFIEGMASIAPHAAARGVTICIEPLSASQADVLLSLEEAAAIVKQIGSPSIQTIYDPHNAVDEKEPPEVLVNRYFEIIRHVHLNELDGTYPRPGGGYNFRPVLQVLKNRGYAGWLSMEIFDFSPGAEKIITEAGAYLRDEISKLA